MELIKINSGFHKFYKLLIIFLIWINCNKSIGEELISIAKNVRYINESHKMQYYKEENSKSYNKPIEDISLAGYYNLNKQQDSNITTSKEFSKFDFSPIWMSSRSFWNRKLEKRFKKEYDQQNNPLKIILVMHSHNDPGWLQTYLEYFESKTMHILNSVIAKMIQYKDMTFVWSEICFLQLWWDQANPSERKALQTLVNSGRFEILTGGWVMTDEANVHIYAMIDQLIEGHQWLNNNLNTIPTIGWSIDPFGHGATMPYLLSASNFDATIIQRIHYAWKYWFAIHKNGDFIWQPAWKTSNKINRNLLTHNMPFDIYTIIHSCGPENFICSEFHFNKYWLYNTITPDNIASKANLLIGQYARTASLLPYNVALILLGDDFAYDNLNEIDLQYINYKKLIDYINNNKNYYNAEISFGTPKDYFHEIYKRNEEFSTLQGDFFVYSDIFTEGIPSYWSGYYTTRPTYKILCNELENNLRSTEILYTIALNNARNKKCNNYFEKLYKNYDKLILARRNFDLFQHHDAITGTSTSYVMRDYSRKLLQSLKDTIQLQEIIIEMILKNYNINNLISVNNLIYYDTKYLPQKKLLSFKYNNNNKLLIVFNSLSQKRIEIIKIRTATPNIIIINNNDNKLPVKQQINPIWKIKSDNINVTQMNIVNDEYEIIFLVELPPLTILTYYIKFNDKYCYNNNIATIYCNDCIGNDTSSFQIINKPSGDIQFENNKIRLLFNENNGFLQSITRKNTNKTIECNLNFGLYNSIKSGAYIFSTDINNEINIFQKYNNYNKQIIIITGELSTDIIVNYGLFLLHRIRILNTQTYLDNMIYIENDIDIDENNINHIELFMRFKTNIMNNNIPEFYTDQNGFQFQHRIKVESIGIAGNYYPITTAAFIQDKSNRMTLLTTHAQGAASLRTGELEIMLDRRTGTDGRGMYEDVIDSTFTCHKFILLIEDIQLKRSNQYEVLSLLANNLANNLRYPSNVYFIDDGEKKSKKLIQKFHLIQDHFPFDIHLMNIRTLTEPQSTNLPSRSALILFHRQGYDYNIGEMPFNHTCNDTLILSKLFFNGLQIEMIKSTSLTGLDNNRIVQNDEEIFIEPMDIQTFNLTFALDDDLVSSC